MSNYYLMHENDICIIIDIDEYGHIVNYSKPINTEIMPFVCKNENVQKLKEWWNNRAIPINRKRLSSILNAYNCTSSTNLLTQNLGLSLTDHYWIKDLSSDYTWEDVNLFTNYFEDNIGTMMFSDYYFLENQEKNRMLMPSSSLSGELPKKWIVDKEGNRCLIKTNLGSTKQYVLE